MPDRIPIGTLPGITSQLDDVDILIATLGVAGTVTGIFLRHTDYIDVGVDTSVVGSVRNTAAGGGEGIAFTIVDQTQSISATGTLAVTAAQSIYLRVSAGSASMNLTGWIEVSGTADITTALTSLIRVKEFLGITAATDDTLITELIGAVDDEIQNSILQRKIIQATATDEKYDSIGDHRLILRNAPVVSVASVSENGTALVEGTDWEAGDQDLACGRIVRISGTDPIAWASGRRVVSVTYNHGYATVPKAVERAATELVAFDFRQSQPGGNRFALTTDSIDAGGAGTYRSREEILSANRSRLANYMRVWI